MATSEYFNIVEKNISDKDKKDWENFLLKKDSLPNKDDDLKDAEKSKNLLLIFMAIL